MLFPTTHFMRLRFLLLAGLLAWVRLGAQDALVLSNLQSLTNGDVQLQFVAPAGMPYRVESATGLGFWDPLVTLNSKGTNLVIDSAAPYWGERFYRAVPATEAVVLTGDHLSTSVGDVVMHPVNHASFVMRWNERMIYNDPVGGALPYKALPQADLILISHAHPDHLDGAALRAITQTGTVIIGSAAVWSSLSPTLKALTIPLAYGGRTNVMGLTVEAVPAYNGNHPKGSGNGYVVTIGDRRIFISGDTGNITEMRALTDIDVAFVCMNLPWTMSVADAATAVRAFQPKVVYPYHFKDTSSGTVSDVNGFKKRVGTDLGIEVRLRKWY